MKSYLKILSLFSTSLSALPSGGQIVQGDASIFADSHLLQIQANGKTIIEWQGFDIGVQERVSFAQTHSSNPILNKVLHGEISQILGQLRANCPIYLVNPRGVFIGSAAQIETAGFLATTADISNEQFLSDSELLFEALGDGSVVNLGHIQAISGDVFLIARSIENAGSIEAENGQVCLSTTEMMLNSHTKECVFIRLSQESDVRQIDLETTSPYEKAIRHSGRIEALEPEEINGRVYLVAKNGDISIDGPILAPSGKVEVLGQRVSLEAKAVIDVSGDKGGSITIGDKELTKTVFVDMDAALFANGQRADGGVMSIWAQEQTQFHGTAEARAVGTQGNGGFIEISSFEELLVSSHPDLRASNGSDGTLLFDPGAVRIDHSMTSGMGGVFGDSYCSMQLGLGNFSLSTTIDGTTGAETLTVNGTADGGGAAVVSWSSSNTFTLTGARNVALNAGSSITATGAGGIVINGGLSTPIAGTYPGIVGNGTIQTNTGPITLTGFGGDGTSGNRGVALTGSGSLTQSADGTIQITGVGKGGGASGSGNNNQGIFITSGATVTTTGLGNIIIDGTGSTVSSNANRGVEITAFPTSVTATGSGGIDITGVGGGATSNNIGISIQTTVSTIGGQITMHGTGAINGTSGTYGVHLLGANALVTSETGDIDLTGIGNGTGSGDGIRIESGAVLSTTVSGDLTLTGTGAGIANGQRGVLVVAAGRASTTSGQITVHGTGAPIGTGCHGIFLTGANSLITTETGVIDLTGEGQGAGTSDGIQIAAGAKCTTTMTGNITLNGTGSTTGAGSNNGINITGASSAVTTTSGDIHIVAQGGGTTTNNRGLIVQASGSLSTNSGPIVVDAVSAAGTGGCDGITLTGGASSITTTSGDMHLAGQSLAGGTGFNITSAISSDTGNITLIGSADGAQASARGISNTSSITTNTGDISIFGTATNGGGISQNDGVFLSSGSCIVQSISGDIFVEGSTIADNGSTQGVQLITSAKMQTGSTGSITITASSAHHFGFIIQADSFVSTVDGPIFIQGTGQVRGICVNNDDQPLPSNTLISSVNGSITLIGDARGDSEGIAILNGASVFSSGNGSISMQTPTDQLIGNGARVYTLGSGNIAFDTGRDLMISGSNSNNFPSFASIAGGMGTFQIGGNLLVTGGLGTNSPAFVGNNMAASASGAMSFSINGNCTLTGQTSFAQIGHVNQPGATLGGNISMTAGSDISVIGGSNASAYARVGHGGQAGGAIFALSNIQLLAGVNLAMISNVGEAQIVNSNGPLTLVVDNLFPSSPKIGPGGFFLNSNLSATGELRIYTARRTQNSINDLINGAAFVPGPFDVDTATEQWRIYFSGGVYGGGPFTIYYKEPNNTFYNLIAANLVQLADLLPMTETQRLPFTFPNYHFQLCETLQEQKICAPTFSPFGSFIFEDDVYWIGAEF